MFLNVFADVFTEQHHNQLNSPFMLNHNELKTKNSDVYLNNCAQNKKTVNTKTEKKLNGNNS